MFSQFNLAQYDFTISFVFCSLFKMVVSKASRPYLTPYQDFTVRDDNQFLLLSVKRRSKPSQRAPLNFGSFVVYGQKRDSNTLVKLFRPTLLRRE